MKMIKVDGTRAWPPMVTQVTKPFWDGLRQGVFRSTQCNTCGKLTFPPKMLCPHCWSRDLKWSEFRGTGTLYSRTTVHFTPEVFQRYAPLEVGIVDLDENVRIACAVVGKNLPLDSKVRLVTLMYDDGPLFGVEPA